MGTSENEQAKNAFLEGKTGAEKMLVFTKSSLWRSIYPQVGDWVLNNYERWEAEKEEWFTEALIATIPDDMIPAHNLELLGGVDGRRRSSFAERMSFVK